MRYFILTENHEIAEVGLSEYAEFRMRDGHIIDRTETPFHVISTVFLSHDHNSFGNVPQWFETMTFHKDGDEMGRPTGDQWRFPTWKDARAGHRAIVRLTRQAEAEAAEAVKRVLL